MKQYALISFLQFNYQLPGWGKVLSLRHCMATACDTNQPHQTAQTKPPAPSSVPCTPGHRYLPHLGAASLSNAPEVQCGTFLWCPLSAWAMQGHTGAMVLQNQQPQPLLLSLSVTKRRDLIGNLSKPSRMWEMKHLECTQATSSIPEETLQKETSDVRRPENRLVPSPRIKHQPEGLNFR